MNQTERVQRATAIALAALDLKALELVALDVHEVTSVADTFILVTGTSDRHSRAIADSVVDAVRASGEKPLGVEGYDEGRWVLIDLGDVIVHVFQSEVRAAYDLERLWCDAPPLELGAAA
jgi:ribosome-associated protein